MSLVGKYPVKALVQNVAPVLARFAGGGAAADCTRVAGCGRGVASVKYNAATGTYRITFDDVGEVLLKAVVTIAFTAGSTAAQKVANVTAYNAGNKTMDFFVTDLATPTAKDLATTEEAHIDVVWAASDGPTG